jgi:hypothetical protein
VLDAPIAVADDRIAGDVLVQAPPGLGYEPVDPLGAPRGGREVEAAIVRLAPQAVVALAPGDEAGKADERARAVDELCQAGRDRPAHRGIVRVRPLAAVQRRLDDRDPPRQRRRRQQRAGRRKPPSARCACTRWTAARCTRSISRL